MYFHVRKLSFLCHHSEYNIKKKFCKLFTFVISLEIQQYIIEINVMVLLLFVVLGVANWVEQYSHQCRIDLYLGQVSLPSVELNHGKYPCVFYGYMIW